MVFHRCEVWEQDRTIVKDIRVALDEDDRAGSQSWYGTMTLTEGAALIAGQRYRLVLDDGRTGEFTVQRNTSAGETNRAVAIRGAGPLSLPR